MILESLLFGLLAVLVPIVYLSFRVVHYETKHRQHLLRTQMETNRRLYAALYRRRWRQKSTDGRGTLDAS